MDAKINNLIAWATENGAVIDPSVSFAYSANKGISAYRLAYTAKQEIQLPVKLAMTPEQAITALGQPLLDGCVTNNLNVNAIGKLFFLKERANKDSFYRAYIALLPSLVEIGSPLTWTAAEKAHLKGTNLGSSLDEKFGELVGEWNAVMELLAASPALSAVEKAQLEKNREFAKTVGANPAGHDYAAFLASKAADAANWTSFPNYLYASLIYTSRAFPYYLVNPERCLEGQAILLPVVDLLNHESGVAVEWGCTDLAAGPMFGFSNLSEASNVELCNNYGLKGNEELLLGYGFTLPQNAKANSVALRLKLPMENLAEVETYGITLPDMRDYTSFAFASTLNDHIESNELSQAMAATSLADHSKYEKGVVYFITESIIPDNLMNLFAYLVRNEEEASGTEITLRMKLDGLAKLRHAVEQKAAVAASHAHGGAAADLANLTNALIYRESQLQVYAKAVKMIKHLEKALLAKYKSLLVSLAKIVKKDGPFVAALARTMEMEGLAAIEAAQAQDQVMLMWLVRCYNATPDTAEGYAPAWIKAAFTRLAASYKVQAADVSEYQPLHLFLFPRLAEEAPEIFAHGSWTVRDLIVAGKLMGTVSYTRTNNDIVLVEDGVVVGLPFEV